MRVTWSAIRRIWIRVGLVSGAVFIGWSLLAYRAQPVARAALESDARVRVTHGDGYWSFVPSSPANAGLIFFPGALVDPVAYAPIVHAIADAGYTALLIEVPNRGAFGGPAVPRCSPVCERDRGDRAASVGGGRAFAGRGDYGESRARRLSGSGRCGADRHDPSARFFARVNADRDDQGFRHT